MRTPLFLLPLLLVLSACGTGEISREDLAISCTSNLDCTAPLVCGSFNANTELGVCEEPPPAECADDTECGDGLRCEANMCVRQEPEWHYIAIVSTTTGADEINDSVTPGPDIDAIELVRGDTSFFADVIHASAQGEGGPVQDGGNHNTTVAAIIGSNDAVPDDGVRCDLAGGLDAKFWSMGDDHGFAIVSFSEMIQDGDTIHVWALGADTCDNVTIRRNDTYSVFLADPSVDPTTVDAASRIRAPHWIELEGSQDQFSVVFPE